MEQVLTILWRPKDVPGTQYPEGRMKVFDGIGWAAMFDRWPDPEVYLAFKSGDLGANHTHLDLNSFQVVAYGEKLIVDTGNPPYSKDYFSPKRWGMYQVKAEGHNCVLINGEGQPEKAQGKIEETADVKGYAALVGDASGAYGLGTKVCRRHVVLVRGRYFVLVDEVKTAEPSEVEAVFHTYGTVGEGARRITGKEAELAVEVRSSGELAVEVQANPQGLDPAENVIRAKTKEKTSEVVIATVLYPVHKGQPGPTKVSLSRGENLELTVEDGKRTDRITFARDGERWKLSEVK